jgi:plasmid stabilization system protein ParE
MKTYLFTTAAEQDLAEIIERIATDSPRNAKRVLERFHAAARLLAEMPGMGHSREDVTDKPVKCWAVHSWLIVYRTDRTPLEILRIVHGARDLPKYFQRHPL